MSFFPFVPRNHTPRTTAKCSRCQHTLLVADFYTREDRPAWTRAHWSSRCKACVRDSAREKYRADPQAAAQARRRNWTAQRTRESWRRHMHPEYIKGIDEAAKVLRIRKLTKSFHHSLMLHQHPYPKGYPHSYSAKAAMERLKRAAQATPSTSALKAGTVPAWAMDNLSPAEVLAELRAMHNAGRVPD